MSNSWMGKMCPVLSAPAMGKGKSPLVAVGGKPASEPEALGCQGPTCMWFVGIRNEKGETVDGACSAALIPQGMAQLTVVLANIAAALTNQPKGN